MAALEKRGRYWRVRGRGYPEQTRSFDTKPRASRGHEPSKVKWTVGFTSIGQKPKKICWPIASSVTYAK